MNKNGYINKAFTCSRFLAFLLLVSCYNPVKAQENYLGTVIYDEGGYTFEISVLYDQVSLKTSPGIFYYWYKNGRLKSTLGEYSGNLLHGKYERFDGFGNLRTKGNFTYGKKDGGWRNWSSKGIPEVIETWKNGYLKKRIIYQNDTVVVEPFRDNALHGKVIEFFDNEKVKTTRYKKGDIIQKKKITLFPKKQKKPASTKDEETQPEK